MATQIEIKQKEIIDNLRAIIRHCDCPEAGNPRFDMVLELTKKDKVLSDQLQIINKPEDFRENDLVINQYNEVCKVLICNEFEFMVRRLSDNHCDNATRSHCIVIYRPKTS